MAAQKHEAEQAAQDLGQCLELESSIQSARRQTTLASASEIDSQELARRIDVAARGAHLSPAALEGIIPQPRQRIGNLPYVEIPTTLVLRKVELRPLAGFLYDLTNAPGLSVRQLRLHPPRGDAASTLWDADVTITCLIYAPNDNPRGD